MKPTQNRTGTVIAWLGWKTGTCGLVGRTCALDAVNSLRRPKEVTLSKIHVIAFALLLAAAGPVAPQSPAMALDATPSARKYVSQAAAVSDFTIDQKGVKRTPAAPASGMAIDQKDMKRTGDPLPDVDVSVKRPGSERTTAPIVGGATATDDAAAERGRKINTSKSNLRTGGTVAASAANPTPPEAAPGSTSSIFK